MADVRSSCIAGIMRVVSIGNLRKEELTRNSSGS